jgi:hypothetical protein
MVRWSNTKNYSKLLGTAEALGQTQTSGPKPNSFRSSVRSNPHDHSTGSAETLRTGSCNPTSRRPGLDPGSRCLCCALTRAKPLGPPTADRLSGPASVSFAEQAGPGSSPGRRKWETRSRLGRRPPSRHCEERSDTAIQGGPSRAHTAAQLAEIGVPGSPGRLRRLARTNRIAERLGLRFAGSTNDTNRGSTWVF